MQATWPDDLKTSHVYGAVSIYIIICQSVSVMWVTNATTPTILIQPDNQGYLWLCHVQAEVIKVFSERFQQKS